MYWFYGPDSIDDNNGHNYAMRYLCVIRSRYTNGQSNGSTETAWKSRLLSFSGRMYHVSFIILDFIAPIIDWCAELISWPAKPLIYVVVLQFPLGQISAQTWLKIWTCTQPGQKPNKLLIHISQNR